MATLPFAASIARLNSAVMRHLSDMSGQLDGVAVQGMMDDGYRQALGGMATLEPTVVLATSQAASATQSSMLVVGDVSYRVRSVQPDGGGLTKLVLERQ